MKIQDNKAEFRVIINSPATLRSRIQLFFFFCPALDRSGYVLHNFKQIKMTTWNINEKGAAHE